MTMFDDSPANDNDRLFDYADANDPDEEWEPVRRLPSDPWFLPEEKNDHDTDTR